MAKYNLAQLQSFSRQAGWPENLIAKAAAIWMYESGGISDAHNPRGENSWGLAQINLPYHPTMNVAKASDPVTALRYAYSLYKARPDWRDWYNSNKKYNGTYPGTAIQKATWRRIKEDSEAIYAGGGGNNVIATVDTKAIFSNSDVTATEPESDGSKFVIYAALGLLGIVLISNR